MRRGLPKVGNFVSFHVVEFKVNCGVLETAPELIPQLTYTTEIPEPISATPQLKWKKVGWIGNHDIGDRQDYIQNFGGI